MIKVRLSTNDRTSNLDANDVNKTDILAQFYVQVQYITQGKKHLNDRKKS